MRSVSWTCVARTIGRAWQAARSSLGDIGSLKAVWRRLLNHASGLCDQAHTRNKSLGQSSASRTLSLLTCVSACRISTQGLLCLAKQLE